MYLQRKKPATRAEPPKLTWNKISMHGVVITSEEYKETISETQKKTKTKNKTNKPQKLVEVIKTETFTND